MRAGTRIAARTSWPVLDPEATETAQLNAVAARHRGSELAEDDIHDLLNVSLMEMRVLRRDALHELGFNHRSLVKSSRRPPILLCILLLVAGLVVTIAWRWQPVPMARVYSVNNEIA